MNQVLQLMDEKKFTRVIQVVRITYVCTGHSDSTITHIAEIITGCCDRSFEFGAYHKKGAARLTR